ncbi:MAG: hypothetical protein QM689_02670 [Oscillospiraceae bacterium]
MKKIIKSVIAVICVIGLIVVALIAINEYRWKTADKQFTAYAHEHYGNHVDVSVVYCFDSSDFQAEVFDPKTNLSYMLWKDEDGTIQSRIYIPGSAATLYPNESAFNSITSQSVSGKHDVS